MKPRVVVGYAPALHSEPALDEAAAEAVRRDAVLLVVHAFQPAPSSSEQRAHLASEDTTRPGHAAALRIAERGADHVCSRHPGLEVRALAADGSVPAVLADAAAEADAELLVVGHRGQGGLAELVLDSAAVHLASSPGRPTMIVRRRAPERRGTVLAAIDLRDPADGVLAFAFEEARLRGASLEAISVRDSFWPPVYAGDPDDLRRSAVHAEDNAVLALERILRPWETAYPDVPHRRQLLHGSPGAVLTASSSYADLVVAGAHRHGADALPVGDAHIGSTVHPLLLRADCPVVIIPQG
ncbi:universal stress protein [Catenulispora subtropica]|uniref:Universal stress protein n=1 Tax=Catenulispora subtropica TaxID=450798 RepID=A0ABN2SIP8_9ACTN